MTLKLGMHHRVLKFYDVCSNDDPELTLTFLRQGQIWSLMVLYGEKGKTINFSESIIVYDVKFGRYSYLNEYMNLSQYQRSRSFIDHGPRSLRFTFLNFFSLGTARPIEAKFHVAPSWDGELKVCSNGPGHIRDITVGHNALRET